MLNTGLRFGDMCLPYRLSLAQLDSFCLPSILNLTLLLVIYSKEMLMGLVKLFRKFIMRNMLMRYFRIIKLSISKKVSKIILTLLCLPAKKLDIFFFFVFC